jgi:hypothetical protein
LINSPDIRLLAEGMPSGSSRRAQCPECRQEHFSITRTADGIAFHCHRASCGVSGFVPDHGIAGGYGYTAPERRGAEQHLMPYTKRLGDLTVFDAAYFSARFGLTDAAYDIRVALDEDAYALIIRDPKGWARGMVIRQPVWSGEPAAPRHGRYGAPRAKVYQAEGGAALAWYSLPPLLDVSLVKRKRTVIVEDQISAMRAARAGYRAVSLLGTNVTMSNGQVQEIAQNSPNGVILALDADATDKAFEIGRKWGMAFASFRVAILTCDVKDIYTDAEVRRTLGD